MQINWKLETGKWKMRKANGFTLIELLVVIAIIGILVAIGLVSFRTSQLRARDAQRKSDLKQVANSLEVFYSDHSAYPGASSGGLILGCPSTTPTACSWGSGPFTDDSTIYFQILPKDPSSGLYFYRVDGTHQKFQLFARLENAQDLQIISTSYSCGTGGNCNFAITSPNTTPTDF